jgi:hypothetical protein
VWDYLQLGNVYRILLMQSLSNLHNEITANFGADSGEVEIKFA